MDNQRGKTASYFPTTCAEQEKQDLLALVGLVAIIPPASMIIAAVITFRMLIRGKTNLVYPNGLKSTKRLST